MPNVMSQDSGASAPLQSKLSRGRSERKWTAVCQLVCGILALGCGVTLITLESPQGGYKITAIETMENTSIGIWGGLIFVTTGVLYATGRHNKSMIGVYFGLCILSLIISLLGFILSLYTVVAIIEQKYFNDECALYPSGCCFNGWGCNGQGNNHYNYHYGSDSDSDSDSDGDSGSESFVLTTPSYDPLSDYNSPECRSRRLAAAKKEQECLEEIWRLFGPHQIILGILIAVLSVEGFASSYGACASIVSFCDCSWTRKRKRDGVVYLLASFGQPVNGNNCNSWMMVPVSAQTKEQGMISTQPVADCTVLLSQTAVPSQTAPNLHPDSGVASPLTESESTNGLRLE